MTAEDAQWLTDALGADCSAPGFYTVTTPEGRHFVAYLEYRGIVAAASSPQGEDAALAALRRKLEPLLQALRSAAEIPAAEEINMVAEHGDRPPVARFVRPMSLERARLELELGIDGAMVFLDEATRNFAIVSRGEGGEPQLLRIGRPVYGDDAEARPLPIPGRTPEPAEELKLRAEKAKRIRPLLRCPRCHGELDDISEGLRCGGCQRAFSMFEGRPVFAEDPDYDPSPRGRAESQNTYGQQALSLIEKYRNGWVLDCGSGSPTTGFYNVVHLELFGYPEVDVVTDSHGLPFAAETFDAILSEAVLEHVRDPDAYTRELARTLKPGGLVRLDVAFLQPYHGYPDHYFNMTRSGLQLLVERAGLCVESLSVGQHQHPMIALGLVLNGYLQGTGDPAQSQRLMGMTVAEVVQKLNAGGGDPFDGLSPESIDKLAAGFSCVARKPG